MMANAYPKPIGPWFPRPTRGAVRQIRPDELRAWTVYEDERLIVIDKPGDLVCHPSKDGPWSSLVGAVRESLGVPDVHMVFRLDRETSGLVVFAKYPEVGRRLQMAAQERRYSKTYQAICWGEMRQPVVVDQPLGPDWDCEVSVKVRVVGPGEGQTAKTLFEPLKSGGGYSLLKVTTETGRKHQIRAHAQWLGHPLVGDKIYGPDPALFLEFVEHGWTANLAEKLLLNRQALHCGEIDLRLAGESHVFTSPLPKDLADFCRERML